MSTLVLVRGDVLLCSCRLSLLRKRVNPSSDLWFVYLWRGCDTGDAHMHMAGVYMQVDGLRVCCTPLGRRVGFILVRGMLSGWPRLGCGV
jgi:hypothetical protein